MKRFSFTVTATISLVTEVEAETLEEAIAEAQSRGTMQLNASNQNDPEDEWVTEIDCEAPSDSELVGLSIDGEETEIDGDIAETWAAGGEVEGTVE